MIFKRFFPGVCATVLILILFPGIAFCELRKLDDAQLAKIEAQAGGSFNAGRSNNIDRLTNTSADGTDPFDFNNKNSLPETSFSPGFQNAPSGSGASVQFNNSFRAPG